MLQPIVSGLLFGLKILAIFGGIYAAMYIIRKGPGLLGEIGETAISIVRFGCLKIRKKILDSVKKEEKEKELLSESEEDNTKVEAHVV